MDRVNFFHLLELNIKPPEADPSVIEAAIKRKQAEWSRLRNHPTKGMQARQNISLLPEIRKVMADPELREKEAQGAREELKKKLEAKYRAIDDTIRLFFSKGSVTAGEAEKIAAHHGVSAIVVQRRVETWAKRYPSEFQRQLRMLLSTWSVSPKDISRLAQKFGVSNEDAEQEVNAIRQRRLAEIDAYVGIQIRKGYMTQAEIVDLADLYSIEAGEILRRIRCPIQEKSPPGAESTHLLDQTVESVINENLKIVGQTSLYSFLGLLPGSSIEALQKRSAERETVARKMAVKDAKVTAAGILAGHCITLFRSDETRYAYDLSRARALLNGLNHEVDLAADDGRICLPYLHFLIRKAVTFGVSVAEARKSIDAYCRDKKWRIEGPKRKRNIKPLIWPMAAAVVLALAAAGFFGYHSVTTRNRTTAYDRLQASVRQQTDLEASAQLLQRFIDSQAGTAYTEKVQAQLDQVMAEIHIRDYRSAQQRVEAFTREEKFEEVEKEYRNFLERHPDSTHAEALRQHLAGIPALIDQRDYQRIVDMPEDNLEAVVRAAEEYQFEHPAGAYREAVEQKLARLAQPYYQLIKSKLTDCEAEQGWARCLALCDDYARVYKDNHYALELKGLRNAYQINLQNVQVLQALKAKAEQPGMGLSTSRQVYADYLAANPNSPARKMIQAEITALDESSNRELAQEELRRIRGSLVHPSGRFVEKSPGAITDSRTGLTWTMLDSRLAKASCLDYAGAKAYVQHLDTAGFRDWRLPTASELKALLQADTGFPGTSAAWYWSKNSYRSYSGGWVTWVDVVAPGGEGSPTQRRVDARQCGWVRAVRP
jgi:hypothetical protein